MRLLYFDNGDYNHEKNVLSMQIQCRVSIRAAVLFSRLGILTCSTHHFDWTLANDRDYSLIGVHKSCLLDKRNFHTVSLMLSPIIKFHNGQLSTIESKRKNVHGDKIRRWENNIFALIQNSAKKRTRTLGFIFFYSENPVDYPIRECYTCVRSIPLQLFIFSIRRWYLFFFSISKHLALFSLFANTTLLSYVLNMRFQYAHGNLKMCDSFDLFRWKSFLFLLNCFVGIFFLFCRLFGCNTSISIWKLAEWVNLFYAEVNRWRWLAANQLQQQPPSVCFCVYAR